MANLTILKELIRKNGYTIKDFAEEINISEQGLLKIIRDNSTKVDTLERIAKQLKISPLIFFDVNSDNEESKELSRIIENNTLLAQANSELVETNMKLTNRILELTNVSR